VFLIIIVGSNCILKSCSKLLIALLSLVKVELVWFERSNIQANSTLTKFNFIKCFMIQEECMSKVILDIFTNFKFMIREECLSKVVLDVLMSVKKLKLRSHSLYTQINEGVIPFKCFSKIMKYHMVT
jgi:hypothetical protein